MKSGFNLSYELSGVNLVNNISFPYANNNEVDSKFDGDIFKLFN